MLKVLVDTCVWLDLLGDYRVRPRLKAFVHLVRRGKIGLIVPRIVVEEFDRNKVKTLKAISTGMANHVGEASRLARKFMRSNQSTELSRHLEDLAEQMNRESEAAEREIHEVERLFEEFPITPTSDAARLRVSRRAEAKLAPFHRGTNSTADALILEGFREAIAADPDIENTYIFITSNHSDFSQVNGDRRVPHPDLAEYFPENRASFALDVMSVISLFGMDIIHQFMPDEFDEPRKKTEIMEMIDKLEDISRYHDIKDREKLIEAGRIVIVEDDPDSRRKPTPPGIIRRSILERQRRQLEDLEAKLDEDEKRELDEWERGELSGRLAALEWLMGGEWDGAGFTPMPVAALTADRETM
ncbi:PIN domain-containing protein [Agrobacterium tumefaciens]|uniref:PIN domain-containing protein n=1 Tax=Agrobacterium tumefaciens TaxID=358 RepID=UPI002AFE8253|nr:PIN domain-containing protein [Agrobacterium tumefaciens]MEA1843417.1 PIN domain-containing protein [Agrobacterium tumefaciens]